MRHRAILGAAAVALLPILLGPSAAADGDLTGRATVIDANTLRIGRSEITLWGIRAPRPGRVCTPFRGGAPIPCGDMATAALKNLIPSESITCVPRETRGTSAPRAVCRSDRLEINRAMVESGWARAVSGEGFEYAKAERRAVRQRAGLWRHLLAKR